MSRFSFSGNALPSNMWLLKRFGLPAARRRSVSSTRGITNFSSLSAGQWSVCSATQTG